jgi:hypothetical protein
LGISTDLPPTVTVEDPLAQLIKHDNVSRSEKVESLRIVIT